MLMLDWRILSKDHRNRTISFERKKEKEINKGINKSAKQQGESIPSSFGRSRTFRLFLYFLLRARDCSHDHRRVMEMTSRARVPSTVWADFCGLPQRAQNGPPRDDPGARARCVGDTWYVCGGVNPVGAPGSSRSRTRFLSRNVPRP